jgi:undecaprenyl-diphosphatase
MDYLAFRLINEWAGQQGWLDFVMIAAARYGALLFAAVLVWLWGVRGGPESAADRLAVGRALAAAGLALTLGQIIVWAIPRARPFSRYAVHLLIPASADPSFPSDHALAAFAIASTVASTRRGVGVALLGLGTLIGLARVFVGTHYPLDVLGGAALGATIGTFVGRLDAWVRPFVAVASRWTDASFRLKGNRSRWSR